MDDTKTCVKCSLNKELSEFTINRKVCKKCRADSQRNMNPKREKISEISLKYMKDKLDVFRNLLDDEPQLNNIKKQMKELNEIYEKLEQKCYTLYFPIKTSSQLQECVEKVYSIFENSTDPKHRTLKFVYQFIVEKRNLDLLISGMKIELDDLRVCISELIDLVDITNALRMSYLSIASRKQRNEHLNDPNFRATEVFVNPYFDAQTSAIVISDNPLKLTHNQFMEEIDLSLADNDYLVVQFKQIGTFDNLNKITISDD